MMLLLTSTTRFNRDIVGGLTYINYSLGSVHVQKPMLNGSQLLQDYNKKLFASSTRQNIVNLSLTNSNKSSSFGGNNITTDYATSTTSMFSLNVAENRNHLLSDYLYKFRWDKLENDINNPAVTSYRQKLIDGLQTFAYEEPRVPVNLSCMPPSLLDPRDINCSDYPNAFEENKHETPVKVAHAIMLGFDADSLEIHLNEIYDVIDYFFILEATKIHCQAMLKQLSWSELSVQPRFAKFRKKIIHLVVDDSDIAPVKWSKDTSFKLEKLQEHIRWNKIKKWNSVTKALSGQDIIGFGDADEVASRKNIQLLKYCPLKYESVDIGIWFPFGRMDQAYKSDFPVSKEHKYTLGDPTFYIWEKASQFAESTFPTRLRGESKGFLLGGVHLTYYTYVPYFILRLLSATECTEWTKQTVEKWFTNPLESFHEYHSLEGIENLITSRQNNTKLKLIDDVKEDLSSIISRPWFYECNKERYPAWEGKHDTRVV